MPGIVLHNRRWGVGSDDCIVPASLLTISHLVWLTILIPVVIITFTAENDQETENEFQIHYKCLLLLYVCIYTISLIIEISIIIVSLRGTVIDDKPRRNIVSLIYVKQGLLCVELLLLFFSTKWLSDNREHISYTAGSILGGLLITDTIIIILLLLLTWCSWDPAGRGWVKLKKFQENSQRSVERERSSHNGSKKSSGLNPPRNWRHRKVRRAYENSWDSRCRMFFCCSLASNRKIKSSFAEIARLLSEFFRDLDVVPSDVLAGLILLRQRQQAARRKIISQPTNNVYDFLSGVKVTSDTKFIALDNPSELSVLLDTVHYMYYAVAAYGWPMYVFHNKTQSVCESLTKLCCCPPCCGCGRHGAGDNSGNIIVDDNCCNCNLAAMKQVLRNKQIEVVYATFHVDVGETPFFISVDFTKRVIVITIRGTLSMKDIITDLSAESELIPLQNINHNWKGHKGMVQSAEYIYNKIKSEDLLGLAYNSRPDLGTTKYPLVCTGHSLGAGTAALLAILLRDREYPDVTCYAFSPPGGLISKDAMEASQSFMTSVVVGKDIVPRIGLHQLEMLRHQLTQTLHQSQQAKWKTISSSFPCCNPSEEDESPGVDLIIPKRTQSVHQPLYPPGRIIHIVRHHPKTRRGGEPAYQGVWADNKDFDEVLISKRMLQDHMPDNVLDALEKASQVHAWQSAVNTVNITRNKTLNIEYNKEVGDLSLCLETREACKTVTLNTGCSQSETFTGSQNITPATAKSPIDSYKKDVGSQEVAESQNIHNDCDASDDVNKSKFPLDLSPSSCLFTQSISLKHKTSNVLDMNLQKCDMNIEGVFSSSSYVYTQKTEISKTELVEGAKLTQEISSFYDNDISNSSTV